VLRDGEPKLAIPARGMVCGGSPSTSGLAMFYLSERCELAAPEQIPVSELNMLALSFSESDPTQTLANLRGCRGCLRGQQRRVQVPQL
jgi:hypothetical protein